MLWMGIDVGTGGTRALVINLKGEVVASASRPHPEISMPRPLWAEQWAGDWWSAAKAAIQAVLAELDTPSALAGIGLTGQMHGVALLDERGEILGPSLIWCDQRTQPQVDELNQKIGPERILRNTANPLLTGFSAPKIRWEQQQRPAEFARARHFLLPKDYIRFQLTGEYATDVADASGTGLFDVLGRRWSAEMLAALELRESFVPRAFEGPEITGHVHAAAAAATGLRAGIPVIAGGGDQAAGAIGSGLVEPGLASSTIGTSGVVFAVTDQPRADAHGRIHTFCHSVPGQWHVMGVTQGAGLSLRWFRDQLGGPERQAEIAGGGDAYDHLAKLAATTPPGAQGLFFLPYLMGERAPHLDPLARGGWIGLTAAHTRAHLARAVFEGVTFSLRDSLAIFRELGLEPTEIRLSGGGARSSFWAALQADIFGVTCTRLSHTEGAAYGAALLAMAGTGGTASLAAAAANCLRIADSFTPDAQRAADYTRRHQVYRELYPRLRETYRAIAALEAGPAGS